MLVTENYIFLMMTTYVNQVRHFTTKNLTYLVVTNSSIQEADAQMLTTKKLFGRFFLVFSLIKPSRT